MKHQKVAKIKKKDDFKQVSYKDMQKCRKLDEFIEETSLKENV